MLVLFMIFLASLASPESLVVTIINGAIALGLTQFIKNASNLHGIGAMILAVIISFVAAVAAMAISIYLSGESFSIATITASGLQIFALATIAYKLLIDKEG